MTKIFESEFFFGGKSNGEMPRKTPVRIVLVVTSSIGSVRPSYLLSSLESAESPPALLISTVNIQLFLPALSEIQFLVSNILTECF